METKEGEYTVKYTSPAAPCQLTVTIQVESQPISNSPFYIQVVPMLDMSGVHVKGEIDTRFVTVTFLGLPGNYPEGVKSSFSIVVADERAKLVPNLKDLVHVNMRDIKGDLDLDLVEKEVGEYQVFFTPMNVGELNTIVQFENQDVQGKIAVNMTVTNVFECEFVRKFTTPWKHFFCREFVPIFSTPPWKHFFFIETLSDKFTINFVS